MSVVRLFAHKVDSSPAFRIQLFILIVFCLGSVQDIACIPYRIKCIYKTVWEIPQRCIVDMAAERGPYICQSQSLTIHMAAPDYNKLVRL